MMTDATTIDPPELLEPAKNITSRLEHIPPRDELPELESHLVIPRLHSAVRDGRVQHVKRLLGTDGIVINEQDAAKQTALHYAVTQDTDMGADLVTTLLRAHSDVNIADVTGSTPLHLTVRCGCVRNFNLLMEQPLINLNIQDQTGNTALHYAVQLRQIGMCKALLDGKASMHLLNNNYYTPVVIAKAMQYSEAIDLLLKYKTAKVDVDH